MYNVYENKTSLRGLHVAASKILQNHSLTKILLGSYRRALMNIHLFQYKWKHGDEHLYKDKFSGKQQFQLERCYVHKILSCTSTKSEIGSVRVVLPFKHLFTGNFLTPCLHGGVTASLIDHCSYQCAVSVFPRIAANNLVPVSVRFDYLAPAPCFENIICESKMTKNDDNNIWVDTICWNSTMSKKLVLGRSVYKI